MKIILAIDSNLCDKLLMTLNNQDVEKVEQSAINLREELMKIRRSKAAGQLEITADYNHMGTFKVNLMVLKTEIDRVLSLL